MRPTGRLHLGNYFGALRNWVKLQSEYTCYFSVADWHMLTTGHDDTTQLQENTREMVLDWLAAGVDPEKAVVFRQSDVAEHAELALLLGMVTPLNSLENNPTWKEQLQELAKTKLSLAVVTTHHQGVVSKGPENLQTAIAEKELHARQQELRTYGFLGYPVLQAADILLYHGTKVPVGQDQVPHVELSREIARKFNHHFGPVFEEPQPLLTETPKVPGLDGRKMSKSYGNTLDIYETEKALEKKCKGAYTDPNRKAATDPGHPLPCAENPPGCSVYALHKLYASEAFYAKRGDECRAGGLGCGDCKKDLLGEMAGPFAAFRERRESFTLAQVDQVLAAGAAKARAVAQKTMAEVRAAVRLR